jgi:hypothetical protein
MDKSNILIFIAKSVGNYRPQLAADELTLESNKNWCVLQRLSDADIDFVVGGVAAVLHGSSTVTRDLDVCSTLGALDLLGSIPGSVHSRTH